MGLGLGLGVGLGLGLALVLGLGSSPARRTCNICSRHACRSASLVRGRGRVRGKG